MELEYNALLDHFKTNMVPYICELQPARNASDSTTPITVSDTRHPCTSFDNFGRELYDAVKSLHMYEVSISVHLYCILLLYFTVLCIIYCKHHRSGVSCAPTWCTTSRKPWESAWIM